MVNTKLLSGIGHIHIPSTECLQYVSDDPYGHFDVYRYLFIFDEQILIKFGRYNTVSQDHARP